jgi:hypothetical protein
MGSTIVEIYLVVKTNIRWVFGRKSTIVEIYLVVKTFETERELRISTIVETDGTRFTNTKKKRNAVKHQKFSE